MKYEKHALNFFPEIDSESFESLKNSISNGFDSTLGKITRYEGKILDGWNRYRACLETNQLPVFTDFVGNEEEAFMFSVKANQERRHLTKAQLAMIAINSESLWANIQEKAETERKRKIAEARQKQEAEKKRLDELEKQRIQDKIRRDNERRIENERIENERIEREKALAERLQREKDEAERQKIQDEKDRIENERLESVRLEKVRKEKEAKAEIERIEKEKRKKEMAEKIPPSGIDKKEKETRTKLGKVFGVNERYISDAKKIKAENPEIAKKIETGEMSISEAKKIAKREQREKDKQALIENGKDNPTPNNITLLEGDLFDKINEIPDNSVDLLNTDPPYMVLDNDWDTFESKKEFLDFTERWLKVVMPKMKSTGRVYISFAQWYQYDFYNVLAKNDFFGFIFKQNIIWYYKNNNQPSNRKEYRYMFEPIFYLYGKDAPVLNFTPDTYGEIQQNVWEIAMPQSNFNEGKYHSAQKPIELYDRIIKTGSFDGDTVLDCFAGSGTTGIVCKNMDRNCVLIEKDLTNINLIKGRL